MTGGSRSSKLCFPYWKTLARGEPLDPPKTNREAKSWGGRSGNRQNKEKNLTPFYAVAALRNPSLPARINETGATPPGERGPGTPL